MSAQPNGAADMVGHAPLLTEAASIVEAVDPAAAHQPIETKGASDATYLYNAGAL
mgnify:CR=1 FL=1